MAYGDWMNGLQGMTTALGAASPYAQQLSQNNAQQMDLAQMIRSGAFGGYGGGYPPQSGATYGGGAPMTPQPYSAPTPFTGFADVLKPKTAPAPTILPGGDPSNTRYDYISEGIETNEVTGGLPAPEGKGYDNFRDWWNTMKELPGFVAQFTPSGIANQIYQNEFSTKPTTISDAVSTGGPISGMARPTAMVEILSRSPYALPPGEAYPIPEVEQGILSEPSPIPVDEVYQQWLADQINAGQKQEASGPNWWDQQLEEEY